MLLALGFEPLKAAGVALIGNTAPAAFGAIATPIVTLSGVTGIGERDLGAMVGRQLPFLALLVPFVVVYMVDGRRGLRETWPVALVAGSSFAAAQFATSNYVSVELTDVVASLASLGATTAYLWLRHRPAAERRGMGRDTIAALSPYLILIAVLTLAQVGPIKRFLADRSESFRWPGLDVTSAGGDELARAHVQARLARRAGHVAVCCPGSSRSSRCVSGRASRCAPTWTRSSGCEKRSSRSWWCSRSPTS